jgi:hypothetical protein
MTQEEKQYLDARRMASTFEDDECPPTLRTEDIKTTPMASPEPLAVWECSDCAIQYEGKQTECSNCGCDDFRHVG